MNGNVVLECVGEKDKTLKTFGGQKKVAEKQKKVCHYCQKEGHYRRDCRKFAEDRKDESKQQKVKIVKDNGENSGGDICFTVGVAESNDNTWYLDSGATSHMTSNAANITTVISEVSSSITLADGNKVLSQQTGSGKIVAVDDDGRQRTVKLKQILYVPK